MKKRIFAGFCAAMTVCASLTASFASISAADGYDVDVTVELDGTRTAISPYIYGINDGGYLDDATFTAVRQGGNRFTAYNWETNFTNSGSDWKHTSDISLPAGGDTPLAATPGIRPICLSEEAAANGVDYKITTIPTAGFVAADANGEVTEEEAAPSARWKEVVAFKGSAFSMTPDTTDDYVYMDEYINYLVNTLGDATTSSGIQAYNLDNEPGLWDDTHPRLHPAQPTCEEMVSKSIEFASAIKSVDPHAEVYGLTLYGFGSYITLKDAADWKSTYSSQYDWFISYYLDQMAKAEETAGKRLIDVIDLHYYSDVKGDNDCRVTDCKDNSHTSCIETRMQAVRTLYDESYIENSWIGQWYQSFLPILPTIRESIDAYYPGTKHAISEYNFGGGDHISGAIAEADALGTFASHNVYMAALWPLTKDFSYQLSAINLYTNYDGDGASFGDTLIPSSTSDMEMATSYASIYGADTSKVNLVLTNKSMTEAQNATITLNADTAYRSAAIYGITSESSNIQLLQAVNDITDNTFSIQLPAMSVVQIEISTDSFILKGDVNMDGFVNDLDAVRLTDHLLCRNDAVIAFENADLDSSGTVNAFDLGILKRKLCEDWVPEEYPVNYELSAAGKWKITDDMAGKTLTCTFGGEGGYMATIVYGYWDTALNDGIGAWVQDDTTSFGSLTFNGNKEITVSFTVPETATSLQVQVPYYAVYQSGTLTEHDLSEVTLKSVTYH